MLDFGGEVQCILILDRRPIALRKSHGLATRTATGVHPPRLFISWTYNFLSYQIHLYSPPRLIGKPQGYDQPPHFWSHFWSMSRCDVLAYIQMSHTCCPPPRSYFFFSSPKYFTTSMCRLKFKHSSLFREPASCVADNDVTALEAYLSPPLTPIFLFRHI